MQITEDVFDMRLLGYLCELHFNSEVAVGQFHL